MISTKVPSSFLALGASVSLRRFRLWSSLHGVGVAAGRSRLRIDVIATSWVEVTTVVACGAMVEVEVPAATVTVVLAVAVVTGVV